MFSAPPRPRDLDLAARASEVPRATRRNFPLRTSPQIPECMFQNFQKKNWESPSEPPLKLIRVSPPNLPHMVATRVLEDHGCLDRVGEVRRGPCWGGSEGQRHTIFVGEVRRGGTRENQLARDGGVAGAENMRRPRHHLARDRFGGGCAAASARFVIRFLISRHQQF